jgi:hypothetical protein
MNREALINLAIVGAAYVVVLLLFFLAPVPTGVRVILTFLVGPLLFVVGSLPQWSAFAGVIGVVSVLIFIGARFPGAGLIASALASTIWIGCGAMAVLGSIT